MECVLLGTTYSYLIQFILGLICFLILVYKRYCDKYRRSWFVWFLDISKQLVSSLFGHFIGIFYSIILTKHNNKGNECSMYLIVFLVDNIIGLLLAYYTFRLYYHILDKYKIKYNKSGDYGEPPNLKIWFQQMVMWSLFLIWGKLLCGAIILGFHNIFIKLSIIIYKPFTHYAKTFLVLVMIICPLIFNGILSWIQDNILKKKENRNINDLEELLI